MACSASAPTSTVEPDPEEFARRVGAEFRRLDFGERFGGLLDPDARHQFAIPLSAS
jgi:hypothetical protein